MRNGENPLRSVSSLDILSFEIAKIIVRSWDVAQNNQISLHFLTCCHFYLIPSHITLLMYWISGSQLRKYFRVQHGYSHILYSFACTTFSMCEEMNENTVQLLLNNLAEEFNEHYPGCVVYV